MANNLTFSRDAVVAIVSLAIAILFAAPARGQFEYEGAPIHYATAPTDEPVSRLSEKLEAGEAQLDRDPQRGYLVALLEALEIPVSSQVLVFSKTSFQRDHIAPRTPRAIYFSDELYLGSIPGSDLLELTAFDAELGPIFYTVNQSSEGAPSFLRQNHECTQCHASALTRGTPGHIVRSVYPDAEGLPLLRNGSFITDHGSPLRERWGGWYVTGRHGASRHLGNQVFDPETKVEAIDREPGANITSLDNFIDTRKYLTGHSDLVALMILEHQVTVQNQIANSVYQTRYALRDAAAMNEALGRADDFESESTSRRIQNAAEALVKAVLLSGEATLSDKIEGTSGFSEEFAARGPRDSQGRSLRELDLRTRLFRYPCSYLIYSNAIKKLPPQLKSRFFERLAEVLNSLPAKDDYAHLTPLNRLAIHEILLETHEDYAKVFVPRE
jgi:hypothetical protein